MAEKPTYEELEKRVRVLELAEFERKRAAKLLRESENRYRSMFENNHAIMLLIDPKNKAIMDANPAACTYYGWSREELMKRRIDQLNSLSPDEVYAEMQLARSGKNNLFFFKHRRADGTVRDVEVYSGLILLKGKELLFSIVHDITDRLRTEEALKSSRSLLSASLESTADGILIVDSQGKIILRNQKFAEMWKIPKEVLSNHDDDTVLSHVLAQLADPDLFMAKVKELYTHPEESSFDQIEFIDGRVFERYSQPQRIGENVVGRVWSFRDITERKWAEETLRESEERFRSLLQSIPSVAVQGYGPDGMTQYWNQASERLYGYSSQEAIGRDLLDLIIPPEMRADVAQAIQQMAETGQPIPASELSLMRKDGSRVAVFSSHAIVQIPGRMPELFCVDIDLTERKLAEAEKAELEAQNRQLQKAESLSIMAGAIAHHFNNQLQVVMGNLEMATDDLPRGSYALDTLTEALKAARKAAKVSSLMLTYLGHTPGKREPLDLSEVCSRSLPMIQTAIPKNVILEADLQSPGPAVMTNANQIQQVIINLITNAWEAVGQSRSSIHLRVKTVSPADIPATHHHPIDWQPDDNPYACLEVSDTGCGIANKDIEKIFDPFFSSRFTGRGLGLSVVLGIVRAHGGVVTVESEPGRWSVFRVFFPLSSEEVPRQPDKAAQAPEIQGGGTILLVEDEEMVRNMAATMLTRLGFTVLEAKDGVEAMEVFRQHQDEIRCVLSDLTMPHMDGWETLAALRKLSPDLPVILSSGYDEARVMSGEHLEHPQAFLGKPYQLKDLRDAISRILSCSVLKHR